MARKAKKKCESCSAVVETFMSHCPNCGDEQEISIGRRSPKCPSCESPVSRDFNFCYCCDEDLSPEEWQPVVERAPGFELYWECDSSCGGNVASHMNYCPSCGDEQFWWNVWSEEGKDCPTCTSGVSDDWTYCVYCGEEVGEGEEEELDDDTVKLARVVGGVLGGAVGTVAGPLGTKIGAAAGAYAAKPALEAAKEHGPRAVKAATRAVRRLY